MKKNKIPRKLIRTIGLILIALFGIVLSVSVFVSLVPGSSARLAVETRRFLGPKPVAWMETVVFTLQDLYQQAMYGSGLERASAPWRVDTPTQIVELPQTPTFRAQETRTPSPSATPEEFQTAEPSWTVIASPTVEESATPVPPPAFALAPLTSSTGLAGEGVWEPYLFNSYDQPVALRTFLQPDPKRSYAILSVVAFDLRKVRLHFLLGSSEPRTGKFRLKGMIPEEDRGEGHLLAAFNGGFLPIHGDYGAMADGIVPIKARDGLATVAIDRDGRVSLGAWGSSIQDSPDWAAWRQNGLLLIEDGKITNAVIHASLALWGGTIDGNIVTWRSALGLSRDRQVLYYAVGPAMGIDTLAKGLLTVGVDSAMQLDINPSWTHFIAVRYQDGQPVPEPLLKDMYINPGRYLKPCARDFFYVTVR